MFAFIRHSHKRLRPWLFAAAVLLLLTSVIEAGHAHGVFTAEDDHCVLCQHSVALDQAVLSGPQIILFVLFAVFVAAQRIRFISISAPGSTLIRAPPF